tara:strand:+ start:3136 stop:4137 length:1002 start_codon:yes stop_codon:yes gene_type:complete
MTYTTLSEDKRFRLLDILQKNKGKLKDQGIFDRCCKAIGQTPGLKAEEVSRRNKPSNIKKKKTLDAALEKLKNKRSACKEDFEGVLRKDDPARRTPGKTITTTAKTTGYEKGDLPASKKKKQLPQSTNSAIVKTDKKSTVITREKGGPITQKQNPRVGQPDGPDDKRTKRGERKLKAISKLDKKRTQNIKKRLDKTKDAAGNVAQGLVANRKAVGDLGGAYGTSTFKENIKSNWRSELAEDAYAAKQGGGLWLLDKGLEGAANIVKFGSTIFNMAKKRKESPGQMRLPGFQGAKKKETSWGHSKNAHKDAIDKWRKDNGLPPDSKALPPWAGK